MLQWSRKSDRCLAYIAHVDIHWYITGRLRIERLKAMNSLRTSVLYLQTLWEILLWFWNKHRSSIATDIATIEKKTIHRPKEPGGKVGEEAAKSNVSVRDESLISAAAAISNSATSVWPSLSLPPSPFCTSPGPLDRQPTLWICAESPAMKHRIYRVTIHKPILATTLGAQGIPEIIDFRLIRAIDLEWDGLVELEFGPPFKPTNGGVELELDDHDAARFMTVGSRVGSVIEETGLQDARVRAREDSGVEFRSFGGPCRRTKARGEAVVGGRRRRHRHGPFTIVRDCFCAIYDKI